MSIPPGETIGFWRSVIVSEQFVYTVFIDGRTLTPADRGRASWPRTRSLSSRELIVLRATLWLGTLADRGRHPNIVWTFAPIVTATVDGVPTALGLTVHVLVAAGLTWSSGRPTGVHQQYPTVLDYLEAVAELTARAQRQRWRLNDPRHYPAAAIAELLTLPLRQLYVENRRAQITMDDIRRGRVSCSYLQLRRALMVAEPEP